MQADKGTRIGSKWPLERRCAVVGKNCTLLGLYCEKCEGKSKSQENSDSDSLPSSTKNYESPEGRELAEERGKVEKNLNRCERACCEEMHLTPCDWEKYLELGHQVEDQYDLVDGILVSRAGVVEHEGHTQIAAWICSLMGRKR